MKILAAKSVLEVNTHIPMECDMENMVLSYGKEALSHMQLGSVFDTEDIDLVPVICAGTGCNGVAKTPCFMYIEQRILQTIREHVKDLDGIYLHLHGASPMGDIDSGEHHLLRCIRRITGPYLPIVISCNPHGNLTKEYVGNTTILRGFREAPHTDIPKTVRFVRRVLVQEIHNRMNTRPIYRKLPLTLGGEQNVSAGESVRSINQFMDELEKDERILSCSWHVGYLCHDAPEADCGVVIMPGAQDFQRYAEETADQLMNYTWGEHHEFHYTGFTREPQGALQMALDFSGKPVFLTDSRGNATPGATGANTSILWQVLICEHLIRCFLSTAINDSTTYQPLKARDMQEQVHLYLGMGMNECTAVVELDVTILTRGWQEGARMYGEGGDHGGLVSVLMKGKPIATVVTNNNHSLVEKHQMDAYGIDWDDYDVIVVKQGYIHPELKEKGKLCIVSPAGGVALQDVKRTPFKLIMRPMYPLDDIWHMLNRNDRLEIQYEEGRDV